MPHPSGADPADMLQDVTMNDAQNGAASSEEEGETTMRSVPSDDSSEEEEEDEEEARRIQEGFIVGDEEEEDEEDDDIDKEKTESRRHKKKHRRRNRAPELEDDDLDLLYENTGTRIEPAKKLRRIHRGRRTSASPPHPSVVRRPTIQDGDMDDIVDETGSPHDAQDLDAIWNDDRTTRVRRRTGGDEDEGDLDDDDMRHFIDSDSDEDEGELGEAEREEREAIRQQKARRKALGGRPDFAGIDQGAWDEIFDVFGDGTDYDWALDDDEGIFEDPVKPDMRYQDVFEPSEIRARLLTEDDDLIRAQDIPERMQLATSSLTTSSTLSLHPPFSQDDLDDAAEWVALRLGPRTEQQFFRPTGALHYLISPFIQAVRQAIEFLLLQNLEVPFIFAHKKDYISYFDPKAEHKRVELLNINELWRVYTLSQKFRALVERKKALEATYDRIQVKDPYFEGEIMGIMDSVEVVADATEWLMMRHKTQRQDAIQLEQLDEGENRKPKMPSRISAYEIAKKSIISDLADDFGIKPQGIVANFMAHSQQKRYFVEDPDLPPPTYAARFASNDASELHLDPSDISGQDSMAEKTLQRARLIIATELGKDPLLRKDIRASFKARAEVSVHPTDKGLSKIDEFHPYYGFKYLKDKPVAEFLRSSQFLHILAAEADHLVTVSIVLHPDSQHEFLTRLSEAFSSDSFSDTAKLWNEQRAEVCKEVLEKHLTPIGVKYVREWIREEAEDYLAKVCADELERRVNVKPKNNEEFEEGPSVLAVSWGEGDPKKDVVTAVFLDHAGRLREHLKVDNLVDAEPRTEFLELVRQRKPSVLVVGGFTVATARLFDRIKELVGDSTESKQNGEENNRSEAPTGNSVDASQNQASWFDTPANAGWGDSASWDAIEGANNATTSNQQTHGSPNRNTTSQDIPQGDVRVPVRYVYDEVARIYQHSKRAQEEFGFLSDIGRYCVGMARYWQSPLNEYAALGSDLTAITFEEDGQQLVPKDKLLMALERALLNTVNTVGVDINRAVNDAYYQHLLPFVSGLGPRKAQVVVQRIAAVGTLVNREQFVKGQIMTTQVWLNAAGFLRIPYDPDYKSPKQRNAIHSDIPDPLDSTRIHPQDYELARKMAADALDVDEEDMEEEHPSYVVAQFMKQEMKEKKRQLDLLNLDDFAINLMETQQESKRHTLDVIHAELLQPFQDRRPLPTPLTQWDTITMLSGETQRTLKVGLIVSVQVARVKQNFVIVRLASGIEGIINGGYLVDGDVHVSPENVVKVGQTIPGVIIDVKSENFMVELSSRPGDVAAGDAQFRRVQPDTYYDLQKASRDRDLLQRKKRSEVNQTRRVIKHPNFHNFNSAKAEEFLSTQQRGDVVIRPSSKGHDHLAVTWKVDDGVYQHIDVLEPNADASQQTVGHQLIIEGQGVFSDLDELIVNHVKAMARKVEELMAHEKYKGTSEEALHQYLQDFVKANPTKSIYAFGLNRRKPGYFNLSFMANKNSPIQTWSVKVTPMAYVLFDTTLPTIPQLCDAFKTRYSQQGQKNVHLGGKTPFGAGRGGMTPGGRTPGRVTPGHMSVRHVPLGKTPNPYQPQPSVPPPVAASVYQQQPSGYSGFSNPVAGGWGTPAPGPSTPGYAPGGMNPARAQMLARNPPPQTPASNGGGWGSSSSGWGNTGPGWN